MWKTVIIKKSTDDFLMNQALDEICRIDPKYEAIRNQLSRAWIIDFIIRRWVKI